MKPKQDRLVADGLGGPGSLCAFRLSSFGTVSWWRAAVLPYGLPTGGLKKQSVFDPFRDYAAEQTMATAPSANEKRLCLALFTKRVAKSCCT
jgi:hypothetical protein